MSTTEMKYPRVTFIILEFILESIGTAPLLPQAGNSNQRWSDHGADCLLFEKCLNAYCRGNAALSYLPKVSTCRRRTEVLKINTHGKKLGVFPARSCRGKKIIQMSYIMTTRCGHLSRAGTKHGQRRQYGTRRSPSMKHYVFATRQLWGLNAIGGGICATNKK